MAAQVVYQVNCNSGISELRLESDGGVILPIDGQIICRPEDTHKFYTVREAIDYWQSGRQWHRAEGEGGKFAFFLQHGDKYVLFTAA